MCAYMWEEDVLVCTCMFMHVYLDALRQSKKAASRQ